VKSDIVSWFRGLIRNPDNYEFFHSHWTRLDKVEEPDIRPSPQGTAQCSRYHPEEPPHKRLTVLRKLHERSGSTVTVDKIDECEEWEKETSGDRHSSIWRWFTRVSVIPHTSQHDVDLRGVGVQNIQDGIPFTEFNTINTLE
jgi:hypothetical protein